MLTSEETENREKWNWVSVWTPEPETAFLHFHLGELYFMSTSYPSAYAPHGSLYKFVDPARLVTKDVFNVKFFCNHHTFFNCHGRQNSKYFWNIISLPSTSRPWFLLTHCTSGATSRFQRTCSSLIMCVPKSGPSSDNFKIWDSEDQSWISLFVPLKYNTVISKCMFFRVMRGEHFVYTSTRDLVNQRKLFW